MQNSEEIYIASVFLLFQYTSVRCKQESWKAYNLKFKKRLQSTETNLEKLFCKSNAKNNKKEVSQIKTVTFTCLGMTWPFLAFFSLQDSMTTTMSPISSRAIRGMNRDHQRWWLAKPFQIIAWNKNNTILLLLNKLGFKYLFFFLLAFTKV